MDRCARTSLARGRWCGLWSSETAAARGNPHQKGASALAPLAERLWHLLESGPRATALDGTLFEPVQEGTGLRGGWGVPEPRRAGPAVSPPRSEWPACLRMRFSWRRRGMDVEVEVSSPK